MPDPSAPSPVPGRTKLRIWSDGSSPSAPDSSGVLAPPVELGARSEQSTLEQPLILFPGMGADARLFQAQRAVFPQLVVPAWLEPRRKETLADYARRFAEKIDPGRRCFVGGASFGGMIALEVARHLDVSACLLISSIRSRRELPWKYRWLVPVATALPGVCTDLAPMGIRLAEWAIRPFRRGLRTESPLQCIASERGRFLRWAGIAALRWKPPVDAFPFPIRHLHGEADRVLEARLTTPDIVLQGGGHLLPLTHPWQVNQFLREALDEFHDSPKLRVVSP